MIETERVVYNEKDEYFEIPLEDVVDDFLVTFYIRSRDWRGDVIQKVKIIKRFITGAFNLYRPRITLQNSIIKNTLRRKTDDRNN